MHYGEIEKWRPIIKKFGIETGEKLNVFSGHGQTIERVCSASGFPPTSSAPFVRFRGIYAIDMVPFA
jgi:hypothetical protein